MELRFEPQKTCFSVHSQPTIVIIFIILCIWSMPLSWNCFLKVSLAHSPFLDYHGVCSWLHSLVCLLTRPSDVAIPGQEKEAELSHFPMVSDENLKSGATPRGDIRKEWSWICKESHIYLCCSKVTSSLLYQTTNITAIWTLGHVLLEKLFLSLFLCFRTSSFSNK